MLEFLILAALGLWLALALRACRRGGGGCGGDCARCGRCGSCGREEGEFSAGPPKNNTENGGK